MEAKEEAKITIVIEFEDKCESYSTENFRKLIYLLTGLSIVFFFIFFLYSILKYSNLSYLSEIYLEH